MFLTRSIRRKLVFGLSLVLVMLAVLSVSGLWGLSSYRRLVKDPSIDDRYSASPAHHVTRTIARLRWALPHQNRDSHRPFDRDELLSRLALAQDLSAAYERKLSELPQATHFQYTLHWQMIGRIEEGLARIDAWLASGDDAPGLDGLRSEIDELEFAAAELPELPDTLRDRLKEARRDYRSGLILISVCSIVVLALLISLIRFGYRQILKPIHELHLGARRVSHGNFDFRVDIGHDDEMGELAESFNLMAERFQQTKADLDSQVRERSRQLVRSERLAGVGFLAAGVAHEVNNPLSAVRWAGESLESRLAELLKDAPDDEAAVVQQYVAMIQSESERCQAITRRLLDFSRNHDSAKTQQDITFIVQEVLTLITHMKKYRECRVDFALPSPCLVEISGPEIKQVVLNLVANALDSAGPTGCLEVELIEQIDWVDLRFRDDGAGMDEETLDQLFEPFFTTKPTGEGTGLGLSISHRIVGDHGGTIEAASDGPGSGCTFIVRLPRTQNPTFEPDNEAAENLVRALAVR